MATANTALRVTELDFDSIKNNLKNYLRSQSEFQDYDFEGSGMSVLLDVLAYNTHYMGYYLNMAANEMFLDTAQLRASVLSHAKMIGYTPKSAEGATTKVNIVVTPSTVEDTSTNTLTLERYTRLLGEDINGDNFNFVTLYSNTVGKSANSFTFSNVVVKQGDVSSYQFLMDPSNIKRSFVIPSANVDTTTITVTVQESSSNTDTVEYIIANDITEVTSNSTVYFLTENPDSTYTITFGDDSIGKKPKNGNIITTTLLNTVGARGNNISRFTVAQNIGPYRNNVSVTAVEGTYGGSDKESVEQVRFRAPYFYTTQNRAVTAADYETLILKDYQNIDAVSVWGGEDNDPVVYGKIYLCLKTSNNYFLSNLDKENIKQSLIRNRNVVSIIPEIVDPDYIYIKLQGKVTYNPALTSLTEGQVKSLVLAAITDYNNVELNTFKSTFKKSKLQSYIENAEKSITGSDISVLLQKRQTIALNTTENYTIRYDAPIRKGDFNLKLSSFPQLTVNDITGISRSVFIEEVPQSFTGISFISVVNPGINYTSTPTVTITGDGIGATAKAFIVNRKVNRIEITNAGSEYTRATVSITGGGGSEATAIAKLENRLGTLRTYYFRPNGEKVIVNNNAGTIDYDTGLITLNSLFATSVVENDFYDTNILTINAPTGSEIISPLRNRILTIDFNDSSAIQIDMIAE